jgi:hypothetical protein
MSLYTKYFAIMTQVIDVVPGPLVWYTFIHNDMATDRWLSNKAFNLFAYCENIFYIFDI